MQKYKNFIYIEEMKQLLEAGKREEALIVAEKITISRIKTLTDLSILAEVFFQNKNYAKAKQYFESIYSKSKSRRILAQLVNLSIKLKLSEEAEAYLEEFMRIAPKDFYCHIFRYDIDKLLGKSYATLIDDLEKLKQEEYIDCWAYELAKLYHKTKNQEKCIAECNQILLWFGSGVYAERAMALKAYYEGELAVEEGKLILEAGATAKLQDTLVAARARISESLEADDLFKKVETLEMPKKRKNAEVINFSDIGKQEEDSSVKKEKESVVIMEDGNVALHIRRPPLSHYIFHDTNQYLLPAWKKKQEDSDFEEFIPISSESKVPGEVLSALLAENQVSLEDWFGMYMSIPKLQKTVIELMETALEKGHYFGHMIITGDRMCGKTRFIKQIFQTLYHLNLIDSMPIVRMNFGKLKKLNLQNNKDQIHHRIVIVEYMGQLSGEMMKKLIDLIHEMGQDTLFVLEGDRKRVEQHIQDWPELNVLFPYQFCLEPIREEHMFVLAIEYLSEQTFFLEEEAEHILAHQIAEIVARTETEPVLHVLNWLDMVVARAKKRIGANGEVLQDKKQLVEGDFTYQM